MCVVDAADCHPRNWRRVGFEIGKVVTGALRLWGGGICGDQ